MFNFKQILYLFILFSYISINCYAVDSLKTYRLGEINIYSDNIDVYKTNLKVNYGIIQDLDAISFEDLRFILPSLQLQTNSRGESIFTYRGSQERQTNFFLDGALLSVAWDGRADLGIFNPNMLGAIEFLPVSVLYGPNNMMGTISLTSYERISNGFGGTARIQAGDGGEKNISLTHDGRIDKFNYMFAFNYVDHDGQIASKNTPDDFLNYNYDSRLITNSFKEQLNIYGKVESYITKNFALGASLNYSEYDKGVISEQYKKPSKARFWKYNDNNRMLFTLNSDLKSSDEHNKLKITYWLNKLDQNIDNYTNITFSDRSQSENNNDLTHGVRIIDTYKFSKNNSLSIAANALITTHDETINNYKRDDNNIEINTGSSNTDFAQNLFSLSAEYLHLFLDNKLETKIGAEYDYAVTPRAGLFTEADNTKNSDWGAVFTARYALTNCNRLFLNASRKVRVPSLRESYSAALGKFKVNPNLSPETNVLFEIGHQYNSLDELVLRTTLFANIYDDMIVKTYDSESGLEMRDNIGKAEIYGAEFFANYTISKFFNLDGNITYMYSKGKDSGINVDHLDYRPVLAGGLIFKYNSPFGLKAQAEVDYIGEQYALTGDNEFDKLDGTCLFNFKISYELFIKNYSIMEFYVRLNNITDEFRQVKIGIPAPGRQLVGGVFIRI